MRLFFFFLFATTPLKWGGQHHVAAVYLPWVNSLVEGTNKILLYILAHLCTPEVGEDGWQSMNWTNLPKTWPYKSSIGEYYQP